MNDTPPRRHRPDRDDDRRDDPPYRRPRPRRDDEDDAPRGRPAYRMRDDDAPAARPLSRQDRYRDDDEDDVRRRIRRRPPVVANTGNRVRIIVWSVIGGIVACVLIGVGIWFLMRSSQTAPFKPAMATYLALPTSPAPMRGQPPTKPVGKMVLVDQASKEVDWTLFDLPDDLRATKPEEVVTVVLLNWRKGKVGDYEGGGAAYQQNVTVTVIDLATKTVLCYNEIYGGPPPQNIDSRSSEGTGSKPTKELVEYLKGLPRK
jgi:hypothetical protein